MTFKPRGKEVESDPGVEFTPRDASPLVQRIRAGDIAAFEELYRDRWNQLYNFAFRYVQSSEEAEDVVQEVFFAVWRNRADWHVGGSLENYLFVAVRNAAIGRLRRDATMRRWRERSVMDDQDRSDVAADALVEQADASAEIERALAEMPAKRKAVCALRWMAGLSYAQIAERLGISEKTVENHLGNGIRFMRERMSSP